MNGWMDGWMNRWMDGWTEDIFLIIVQELDHIRSTLSQESQARVNLESQLEAALQKLTN